MFRITTNKPVFETELFSTKSFENKIQRTLRKLETRLSTQQYYQMYPTASFQKKFMVPQNYINYQLMVQSMTFQFGQ